MADDTVEAARDALDGAIQKLCEATTSFTAARRTTNAAIDALVAAVRAESRMTVVKLRDDEASPVAAPCAIAGACQYGEAYENARVRLLNLTTKALSDKLSDKR